MRLIAMMLFGLATAGVGQEVTAQITEKSASYALVRCESQRGRENYCQTDTDRGVRLLRELSRGVCQPGRNYGFDRNGVWVSDGCSAEFEIGWRGGQSQTPGYGWGYDEEPEADETFLCESYSNRYSECEVRAPGGVRLVQQWSRSPCIEGQTWGTSRNGVWVDRGCRAEFAVNQYGGGRPGQPGYGHGQPGYGQPGYGQPGYGQALIRCESRDNRQVRCPANVGRGSVELVNQLSRTICSERENWGYDSGSIWVGSGCRGEFQILAPVQTQLLLCESRDNRRRQCPAQGRYVKFVRQLSRSQCIEGQSYGIDRNGVWVDQGCRAEFEVR